MKKENALESLSEMEEEYSINQFGTVTAKDIIEAAASYGTPLYLYDEAMIINRCMAVKEMPNAFGLRVRYAMKANSTKQILKVIAAQGIDIDASSINEAKRAHLAGIAYDRIVLTTQEVPLKEERQILQEMMLEGMLYNVCSLHQLYLISDFAQKNEIALSIRLHPGVGAGESASRNTGDDYSSFGVHLSDLKTALVYAEERGIKFTHVHTHIGSGGNPDTWRSNIDLELGFVEKYFPDAQVVSFGGGLKEARMPDEKSADIEALGGYAKEKIEDFYKKHERKLEMEIEPGTFLMANAGYVLTEVLDKKETGPDGFEFLILDGGMDVNTRPALYGSRHPFYVIDSQGELLSSEFDTDNMSRNCEKVVAGRCCESGDCQTLNEEGMIVPRRMADPEIGDYVVIGGAGAYCSAMSVYSYNSHTQCAEVMLTKEGTLKLIRRRQTLEQLVENEL